MRLAVILAAIAIKSYFWFRIVPRICVIYALIVLVACAVFAFALILDKKRRVYPDLMCNYPTPIDQDFPLCEYKLRQASPRHPAAMRT